MLSLTPFHHSLFVPDGHHFFPSTCHGLTVDLLFPAWSKKMNRASRVFCDISTMAVSFSTVKAALRT
jgi:hypothetical protein